MSNTSNLHNFLNYLIKLVEKEKNLQIEVMKNEIKRMSGLRREKVGRAILGLKGKVLGVYFGYVHVKYGRSKEIQTEISQGDVVLVSKMNTNPLKSGLLATVVDKGKRFITVAVKDVPVLKNVRVDLYLSETTFRRMIDNLKNLSESGKKAVSLYLNPNLTFEKVKDGVRKVHFKPVDKLNESQIEAISLALGSDCFAIHGPFGTGKTRTAAELVRQFVLKGEKVLATASSNVAVDNFLTYTIKFGKIKAVRIGHPARMSKEVIENSLPYLVENHPDYEKIVEISKEIDELSSQRELYKKPKPKWRRGLSDEEILKAAERGLAIRGLPPRIVLSMAEWIRLNKKIEKLVREKNRIEFEIQKEIIEDCDVVFSTNSTAYILRDFGINFDVTVVDEASQATIPEVLIPISISKRFVLVGDHKQLPPTVEVKELEATLFEKLVEVKSSMLLIQYRMNEELMEFPCREFYGCKIKADESVKNLRISFKRSNVKSNQDSKLTTENPLQFFDTCKCDNRWEKQKKGSLSRENELEADIVIKILKELNELGIDGSRVGIITPYEDQVELIRRKMRNANLEVEVNTVDAFQGREKDVIILSFVRSNPKGVIGFLMDERRLNVSLTRARMKLIAIGDSSTLSSHPMYFRLVEHFRKKGDFVILGSW